jgi:diadenosine tetraphosphate (Ap4A) HIT family hydrolase
VTSDSIDCYNCRLNAQPDRAPREDVMSVEHWRVAHAFDTDLPGWLIVLPTSHVTSIADLTPDAAAELGPILRDLSIALEAETGCLKTYVMQFSEAEGFAHLHFHLVPRMPDQPAEHRGPKVFAHLGHPESSRVTEAARDDLALRLRARLS